MVINKRISRGVNISECYDYVMWDSRSPRLIIPGFKYSLVDNAPDDIIIRMLSWL